MTHSFKTLFAAVSLLGALLLSGCSSSFVPATLPNTLSNGSGDIIGNVYGGRQPIVGAEIFLFEANIGGYESAANPIKGISLLGSGSGTGANANVMYNHTAAYPAPPEDPTDAFVVTAADGGFNLSGDYACDPGRQVWLVSIGGDPGAGSANGTTGATTPLNPYAGLMTALGTCPATGNFAGTLSYIYMNEVSTVAMAYATAGFSLDAFHISSPTSTQGQLGFANAFATAAQLYDISGASPLQSASVAGHSALEKTENTSSSNANGTPPYKLINSLANSIAACVNSSQSTGENPNCVNLFKYAFTDNGVTSFTTFQDTASAAIYIAQHPSTDVNSILNLATGTVPWTPNLSVAPTDLTAAIAYSGISAPTGLAIDSSGYVITNVYSVTGDIARISPLGVIKTSSSNVIDGTSITINSNGTIWSAGQANTSSNSPGELVEVSPSLGTKSGSPFLSGGTFTTSDLVLAADGANNIYVADGKDNQLVQVTASGKSNSIITGVTGNGITCPTTFDDVAIDPASAIWTTSGNSDVCKFTLSGTTPTQIFDSPVSSANALAIDSSNNAWVTSPLNNQLFKVSSTGAVTTPSTSFGEGGGLSYPSYVAIDGGNHIWIVNLNISFSPANPSISEFSNAGTALSSTSGFQYKNGTLEDPEGIGIDPSGNVWLPNFNGNTILELVGAATPTATPLSSLTPGTRP
jgi:hypothetical protein